MYLFHNFCQLVILRSLSGVLFAVRVVRCIYFIIPVNSWYCVAFQAFCLLSRLSELVPATGVGISLILLCEKRPKLSPRTDPWINYCQG